MKRIAILLTATILTGCATTSPVMDTGNGTYMISAHASRMRGGAAGANAVAYESAQKFCAKQDAHPVVMTANSRDTYQGAAFGANGNFGATMSASGNTDLHFRCER